MTKLYRPIGQKTLWPVGSVYISVNSTNPSTYIGGTWKQIVGRFLFCSTNSKQVGGEETHTLTAKEMPSNFLIADDNIDRSWATGHWGNYSDYSYCHTTINNTKLGNSTPFSIMPPYFTVYCWYRTA